MNTQQQPTADQPSRLARFVDRSFDLVDNVLHNVDQLVSTARKDSMSVAREFVGMQVAAAERIFEAGDAALTEIRSPKSEASPESNAGAEDSPAAEMPVVVAPKMKRSRVKAKSGTES